ncbi:MAG: nitroreductase family protein [Methylococcales bacterium]|nr:nitroreductase family protein [Methylococcales bacterium]
MQQKSATTQEPIHELLQMRWSPRAIDSGRDVSAADVTALLEAARWAPSCFNDQPWRFVVFVKSQDEASWQQALSCVVEKNQRWAQNAPVLLLAVAMGKFNHNGQPNRWAMYDTGAASLSLCLQATALGLVTHQMGGFDAAKTHGLFNLPDDCTPLAMIAVGYQAETEILDDEFKAAELAERSRAALGERFYLGQWGTGFE